ncbi:hypothetical protein [Archaeoglobus veneficus]|uniref:HhH-GPD family protein n=1 Tax=Archaeoglobus veneficus (strain DSM 11195 / SNP6) TaxID=693661 RepID=F2KQB3_ARCVS|nr:hypothetical protein [Archaeoglobus veneficus]AEA46546.1 hypothetical protein Arcve_0519 [Archaeoglobus veneficus SNP6]
MLKRLIDTYMALIPELPRYCDRCLETRRWNGSVVLMVVDAAFTSVGLNYFNAVVPKVMEFRDKFVKTGNITCLEELARAEKELFSVWRNARSVRAAMEIAEVLSEFGGDDRTAFRRWAAEAKLEEWRKDPVGRIKGVGINTFQYLRMMGGIDTVMPDKIVKRVINGILVKAGEEPVTSDIPFVKKVHEIAAITGYRPIELCLMTWLVEEGKDGLRVKKHSRILEEI